MEKKRAKRKRGAASADVPPAVSAVAKAGVGESRGQELHAGLPMPRIHVLEPSRLALNLLESSRVRRGAGTSVRNAGIPSSFLMPGTNASP